MAQHHHHQNPPNEVGVDVSFDDIHIHHTMDVDFDYSDVPVYVEEAEYSSQQQQQQQPQPQPPQQEEVVIIAPPPPIPSALPATVVAPASPPAPIAVPADPAPQPLPILEEAEEKLHPYITLMNAAMEKQAQFRKAHPNGPQLIVPYQLMETAAILNHLQQFGFAVVSIPEYSGLGDTIQAHVSEWIANIHTYDKVQHLFKHFNHSGSRQINGFGSFDKNASTYFNLFNMMVEVRWLLTCLVQGMQRLITMAAPADTYTDQHTWLASSHPPFVNERGITAHKTNNFVQRGLNSVPRENTLHNQEPSKEEGQDLMEAIYLSPYLSEYRTNEWARDHPFEHLQLFVPVTNISSEREARAPTKSNGTFDPTCLNSIRIIPGFHTLYPDLVRWIFENKLNINTGELFETSATDFHNPDPASNCHYHLAPACADILRSFMVDIPIHNVQGHRTFVIMDPRMGLTMRFVSHCVVFPMSIWPHLTGVATPKEQAEFTTIREQDVNLGRTQIDGDPITMSHNILYKILRRAYFNHFTPVLLRRNQSMVANHLFATYIGPYDNQYTQTWKRYLIQGFPNRPENIAKDLAAQEELLNTIKRRIPNWIPSMNELLDIISAPEKPLPVTYSPVPQICQGCNHITDFVFECDLEDTLEQSTHTFYYCAACIVQLEQKIIAHVNKLTI